MTSTSGALIFYNCRSTVPVWITPEPLQPLTRWQQIIEYLCVLYR